MKKICSLLFLVLIIANKYTNAQSNQFHCYYKDNGTSAREQLVDFQHLYLILEFDTIQSKVMGTVTHSFVSLRENLDSLILDAVDIKINNISWKGKTIQQFKQKNNLLYIYFPEKLSKNEFSSITIHYECVPKKGLYFIGWNDTLPYSQRQIWTQGQGIDNRHWIPMFDDMSDKITQDIIIRFNKNYQVISNGVLLEKKELKNHLSEWHFKMNKPHAPYLIMLAIGKYKAKNFISKSGVKIYAYYYPKKEYCADTTFRYSAQMMDFLEKETGLKYPWEQYSVIPVQEYMYGAMENTTATIFGDFFLSDDYSINDRDFLPVAAHELAHQWFGDYVTARSPAHVWLQESFATHYNWLVEKEYFGNDHYDWLRKSAITNILKESEKNLFPIAHSNTGTTRIYPKGAYVLHMLKYVIGKKQFDSSIKRYLQKHPYSNVETYDLLTAIYEETGMYLDWFFDEWIFKGGEPHFNVKFELYETNNEKSGIFYISQTHECKDNVDVFKMPVIFEIHFDDGTFISKTEWITKKDEVVKLSFEKNKNIRYILFDPNSNILKKISFDKPYEMLINQAMYAQYMLDRYDAITSLNTFDLNKKRTFLQERYWKESFHAIKSEIVKQLLDDTTNAESLNIIKDALMNAHPLVTRTVIENTKRIHASLKETYFQCLTKTKSYINIQKLMWLLYDHFPSEYQRIIQLSQSTKYPSADKKIEITALAIEYLQTKNKNCIDKIILYASPSFDFTIKTNAFDALIKINYFDDRVKKYLEIASQSANNRLANPAKETIHHFQKIKNFHQ
ncbi:MAG: M1 family metallopeptidase [Bacteroidia bacterium]|nr:M1 family metallopeptidase [Bacteroidia bacterium]